MTKGWMILNPRWLCAGSILSGGGSVPRPQASAEDWVNVVNELQKGSLSTRLGIPMVYGIDAVHGHNNVYKATIFPHNVGLGVTRQESAIKHHEVKFASLFQFANLLPVLMDSKINP